MSTQPTQFSTFILPERKTEPADMGSTLSKYLYHWPLFLLSLAIVLTGLFFYLKTVKPIYTIKATLLINDEKKAPDQQSALHEIDLSNSAKIIENEIEILKSNLLISQVVRDLNLNINYQKQDGFLNKEDLYKTSPVKLTLISAAGKYLQPAVTIVIKDQNSFLINLANEKRKEYFFNHAYESSFGTWKLEPTKLLPQYKGATIKITVADPEKIALQYQKTIDVSLSSKLATAVVITLEDEVPQRGKDILNRLIYNYNSASITEKNRQTKTTLDFLDQRIASLSGELSTAEKGIENFKSSRGLTDISSDSKVSLENMQTNDTQLNAVNVQLSVIEGIERYVNAAQNLGKAPATLGITDPALSSLIEKLVTLQLQRDRLLATTPETNPDFEPINRQIVTTRAAIKENVKNIKTSLLNTRGKLQSYNSRFESSIKNIPTQEREYISIKRQQTIKENLYSYLLQKREEVSVNYASTIADDRLVDQAYTGPEKGQKKSLAFGIALLLSVGLPAGLIYARDSANTKITTLQDIKNDVKIPVIAELPFEDHSKTIVVNDSDITALSEQFRALRTKLYYLYGEKEHGRVTLITSSIPGEGKSFVSTNLGLALAYANKKTIILELDLRKPKIAEIFNLPKENAGISEFLKGKASRENIVQNSGINSNLDIISSGAKVNNPSELLEKNEFKELILSLKEVYDDIIIDSPPVHLVPDAMILSRLTDLTLYAIRQGYTEKSELDFIKELNDQKRLTNINLIFNGIERMRYGYGYKYNNKYYNTGSNKNKVGSLIFSGFSNRF